LAAALAAGCASGQRRLDSAIVTAGGRIGVLQIDESTRADVIAFAGPPDAERRSREGSAQPRYLALGYGCGTKTERRLYQGCETDVHLQSAKAFLTIAFTGGVVHLPSTAVTGGHVWAFVLHGVRGDAGSSTASDASGTAQS